MSRLAMFLFVGTWIAATSWGFWKALQYERSAAVINAPPEIWPRDCKLALDPDRPTLLLFAHPKCPCTRATVRELERLLARHQNGVSAYAIFLRPTGAPLGWEQTDLWSFVTAIPGVHAVADEDGSFRRTFRTTTSGECLVYGTDGELRFHGGITSGRGHEGFSAGQAAVSAAISSKSIPTDRTQVFGCALETTGKGRKVLP